MIQQGEGGGGLRGLSPSHIIKMFHEKINSLRVIIASKGFSL